MPSPPDALAHRLLRTGLRGAARVRRGAVEAHAALQGWAAWAVDPGGPGPAIAPLLSAAIGAAAPPPSVTIHAVGRSCGSAVACLVDDLSDRFAHRWPEPDHARMAAGLFVGSLALGCAGLVGVVSVAVPTPAVHLQRLATVVNLTDAEPATADTLATTTSAGRSTETTTTAASARPPTVGSGATPSGEAAAVPTAEADPVVPVTTTDAPAGARPPTGRGGLPVGKGMWIWLEDRADGGRPDAIVARAQVTGLTHLYVRTGTLKGGFVAGPFLDRLLPAAHAAGLRVYGWDFPYLDRPGDDVSRALAAITYMTPDGHRIDGFAADIESSHEGTNNTTEYMTAYATWLRQNVGPDYPLIATVPNPTPSRLRQGFPYDAILPSFDAVAPMVYWMNRDPASDVANAIAFFAPWGKPVFPIGQAYDGGPEGGPPGVPDRKAIIRFLQYADAGGAAGVSFWSYQHATQDVWDAVRDAGEFRLDSAGRTPRGSRPGWCGRTRRC